MRRILVVFVVLLATLSAQTDPLAEKSRRGNQLMAEGKFAEAAAVYAELVRAVPNNSGLLMNLGMAQHMAGNHRQAVTNFESALRLQKGIVPALVMLGSAYLQLNQPEKAIPPLREVTAAVPSMKEARGLLAQALSATGRHEEAVEHYRQWTGLDATNALAWNGLGVTYRALAQAAFRELEKADPESGYMLVLVAGAEESRGRHQNAFALYREALSRQPGLRGIHPAVADIYRQAGHADWASKEEAKETALPALNCKERVFECQFEQKRYRQLIASAKPVKTARAFYWQSRAYDALAQDAFDRLVQLPPSAESLAFLAAANREQGRHAESVKQWRAALKLRPGDPLLEKELAVSLRLNEDYSAARPIVEKLLKNAPKSAELNYLLGQIILNSGEPSAAVSYLETAVQTEPGFLPARASLGLALLQVGQAKQAIEHLEAALPTDTDGSLHFRLARAYQSEGQRDQAKTTLAKYREIQQSLGPASEGNERRITPP